MSSDNAYPSDGLQLKPADAAAAVILAPDGPYILQLRDRKPGIFFPGHWGLFGGGVDKSDGDPKEGLRRELREELSLNLPHLRLTFFSNVTFDLNFGRRGTLFRVYYEATLVQAEVLALVLGEGSDVRAFTANEALTTLRLVPYDGFAL